MENASHCISTYKRLKYKESWNWKKKRQKYFTDAKSFIVIVYNNGLFESLFVTAFTINAALQKHWEKGRKKNAENRFEFMSKIMLNAVLCCVYNVLSYLIVETVSLPFP